MTSSTAGKLAVSALGLAAGGVALWRGLRRPGRALGDNAYYDLDTENPQFTLRQVAYRYVKKNDKLTSPPSPYVWWFPIEQVLPYREYLWSRERARRSPEEWDTLKRSMETRGWSERLRTGSRGDSGHVDPAHIDIGKDGKILVVEGNHRLALARELGLKRVPVRITFKQRVSRSSDMGRGPFQIVPPDPKLVQADWEAGREAGYKKRAEERRAARVRAELLDRMHADRRARKLAEEVQVERTPPDPALIEELLRLL